MWLAVSSAGCVLPESLEVVNDTPRNYPPSVVSTDPVSTTLAVITGSRDFTITLADPNLTDTLYVRIFVDYAINPSLEFIALIDVPPKASPTGPDDTHRTSATVTIVCGTPGVPPDGSTHFLTAVIADRQFINDSMLPLFQHLPADAWRTEVSWVVKCQ